jgi:hypothetical protein
MKSYTDIEQSKKLAEFLPLESADMEYLAIKENGALVGNVPFVKDDSEVDDSAYNQIYDRIACWSLAALLNIIRKAIGYTLQTTYDKNPKVFIVCELGDKPYSIESIEYDNEVDACYEMILNLHELNLL